MNDRSSARCYIEEYRNDHGQLCARLREKGTGRKVDLGGTTPAESQHLLRFLSAASQNREIMPDMYSKDGDDDCVVISGDLDFDAPDEIRFIYNTRLSYAFA